MRIAERAIGTDQPPFIIAELSGNHGGSLERALETVDAVADAGAHAIKLQTYTADTMTLDVDRPEYRIDDPESLWTGRTLYDLYGEAHTPWAWHGEIFERARGRQLLAFSSPFDASAVDFLSDLDVPAYKIASFENGDLGLIHAAAATGKPLIISTGLATLAEIDGAVTAAREAGCDELALLKCTSSYPAVPADSNIVTIPHLRGAFGCEVGLSDHTIGLGAAIASIALGASIIEKHVTLDRATDTVDSAFSLTPKELRLLVQESARAWESLGTVAYGPVDTERPSLIFRRSLIVTRNLAPGDRLDETSVRALRPGIGLPPADLEKIQGATVRRHVERGEPVTWDLLRG